jgi:hypothetical protein
MVSFLLARAIPTVFYGVRLRVALPRSLNGQIALHLDDLGVQPMTWQVFVDGQPSSGQGAFPPHPDPADPPVSPVITLPSSVALPGGLSPEWRRWHEEASPVPGAASVHSRGVLTGC